MRTAKLIASLIDSLLLVASLAMGGPADRQAQLVGSVALALLACVAIFGAVALVIGLWGRRKPPFPMTGEPPHA
jgi:hypothetical protein